METLDAERILDLLSQKLKLLENILAYSKEQRKLAYRDSSSRYNNLIESRSKCLEDLGKLEVVLERNLNRLSEGIKSDGEFQERLHAINSNITATLKQIVDLDKQNQERLLKERSEIQSKLRIVRQGRKGITGYTGNKQFSTAGIFTDNKG